MIKLYELFTQSGNIQNSAGQTQSSGIRDISAIPTETKDYDKNFLSKLMNNLFKKQSSNRVINNKVQPQDTNMAPYSSGDLNMK